MMSTQETRLPWGRRAVGRGAGALMAVEALSFALASVAHFAADFPDAAIPELLIAVVLAIGARAVLSRQPHAWGIALGTTVFATAGTALGLTIIATGRQDMPDLAYHAGILSALCATLIILIRGGRARALLDASVRDDLAGQRHRDGQLIRGTVRSHRNL